MKGPAPRSTPTDKESDERETGDDRPMNALRQATPKRKRTTHTNSSDGMPLALVVSGAPRGLTFTGDTSALDSLDVHELARLARRVKP